MKKWILFLPFMFLASFSHADEKSDLQLTISTLAATIETYSIVVSSAVRDKDLAQNRLAIVNDKNGEIAKLQSMIDAYNVQIAIWQAQIDKIRTQNVVVITP